MVSAKIWPLKLEELKIMMIEQEKNTKKKMKEIKQEHQIWKERRRQKSCKNKQKNNKG